MMKYKSQKARCSSGHIHDSKKEATRCNELRMLENAGVIQNLRMQVKFALIPTQYEATNEIYIKGKNKGNPKKGKLLEKECAYYADFVYEKDGKTVVEDVKGYRGGEAYNVFTIKRKLMLWRHGIKIKEIT